MCICKPRDRACCGVDHRVRLMRCHDGGPKCDVCQQDGTRRDRAAGNLSPIHIIQAESGSAFGGSGPGTNRSKRGDVVFTGAGRGPVPGKRSYVEFTTENTTLHWVWAFTSYLDKCKGRRFLTSHRILWHHNPRLFCLRVSFNVNSDST